MVRTSFVSGHPKVEATGRRTVAVELIPPFELAGTSAVAVELIPPFELEGTPAVAVALNWEAAGSGPPVRWIFFALTRLAAA